MFMFEIISSLATLHKRVASSNDTVLEAFAMTAPITVYWFYFRPRMGESQITNKNTAENGKAAWTVYILDASGLSSSIFLRSRYMFPAPAFPVFDSRRLPNRISLKDVWRSISPFFLTLFNI